jgi:hypothetical protein
MNFGRSFRQDRMAKHKTKKVKDSSRVAAHEGYEIEYLAETTGISRTQAVDLLKKHGLDRITLVREARRLIAEPAK